LQSEAGSEPAAQVQLAFRLTLCRSPGDEELKFSTAFLQAQAQLPSGEKNRSDDPARRALEAFCLVLLNTNEFAYTR